MKKCTIGMEKIRVDYIINVSLEEREIHCERKGRGGGGIDSIEITHLRSCCSAQDSQHQAMLIIWLRRAGPYTIL